MTERKDYEVSVATDSGKEAAPDWEKRLYSIADMLDARLGARFWTIAGLLLVSVFVGTPHVLVHYQCYGRCGQDATEFNCQYFGVRGWKSAESSDDKCQRIRLL